MNDLLVAGSALLAGTGTGVARSTDGGIRWSNVLKGLWVSSVTRTQSGGYAALGDRPGRGGLGKPIVGFSGDGVHWREVPARTRGVPAQGSSGWFGAGYRVGFSGIGPSAVGIAVPDIVASAFAGPPLRSTDGGRIWTPMALPGANSGLAMLPGGRTVYASAPGPGKACTGAVYRSADAGATWELLRSSCRNFPLYAVQFLDPQTGFAAGGMSIKFGGGQVVEGTTDGGATWHTLWRIPSRSGPVSDSAFVRIDMVDARRGWALSGGCDEGENGPCGGTVYTTGDGGDRWVAKTNENLRLNALVALGVERAVAADSGDGTLRITADAGRHWRLRSPPSAVTGGISGSGGWVLLSTNLGTFRSTDAGRTWRTFDPPALAGGGAYDPWGPWFLAPPDDLFGSGVSSDLLRVRASTDGGQRWSDVRVPAPSSDGLLAGALGPNGQAAVIVGPINECLDPGQVAGLESLKPGWQPPSGRTGFDVSADGGRTWTTVDASLPFGSGGFSSLAIYGKFVATLDACSDLQTSIDGGRTWRSFALQRGMNCTPAIYGKELWLNCQGLSEAWVLHSPDAGATWAAYRAPRAHGPDTLAEALMSGDGIVALGPEHAAVTVAGSVWTTTDGGRSWTQSWPNLPGER